MVPKFLIFFMSMTHYSFENGTMVASKTTHESSSVFKSHPNWKLTFVNHVSLVLASIELQLKAQIFGCLKSSFPFSYLGLPVGANMSQKKNWQPILDKFQIRLSSWKANTLSFGGRLTLIKSVLSSLPTYFLSLLKVPQGVFDSLEKVKEAISRGRKWWKIEDTPDRMVQDCIGQKSWWFGCGKSTSTKHSTPNQMVVETQKQTGSYLGWCNW